MESTYKRANIMYLPALALFAIFVVYPFADGIRIAFTNWNGFSQHYSYVGLRNFLRLATDRNVGIAFLNTLLYGFGSTFFQQVLGLGCALLLDRAFAGRNLARMLIYLPVLVSSVIMGYMWYYLLAYDGALNDISRLFGGGRVLWLSSPALAKSVIVTVNTLQYTGISMVIYLAGLQNIPSTYAEAAALEGAGPWQLFRRVTFPLLLPAIATSVTVNLIGGLNLFNVIMALTGGGPGYRTHSLATLIRASYFGSQMAGFAAANGLLLFVAILVITVAMQRIFRKNEVQFS